MNIFKRTNRFSKWIDKLKDRQAQRIILARLKRAAEGDFGDVQPVGSGVSEMRIHFGKGYRVYYGRLGETVYLLLAGGDKSEQQKDINVAIAMWKTLKGHNDE